MKILKLYATQILLLIICLIIIMGILDLLPSTAHAESINYNITPPNSANIIRNEIVFTSVISIISLLFLSFLFAGH